MDNVVQNISNNKFIDKKEDNYFNSLPTETFSRNEKNSDVINLSELSKIKLEYERDDVKMNNGQFNTENNNLGAINNKPAPTFGGSFFPSLEDEPTNMNMMGEMNQQPVPPIAPQVNNDLNNNLIDLTDLSLEKEQTPMTIPSFGTPVMPATNEPSMPNLNSPEIPEFNIPDLNLTTP